MVNWYLLSKEIIICSHKVNNVKLWCLFRFYGKLTIRFSKVLVFNDCLLNAYPQTSLHFHIFAQIQGPSQGVQGTVRWGVVFQGTPLLWEDPLFARQFLSSWKYCEACSVHHGSTHPLNKWKWKIHVLESNNIVKHISTEQINQNNLKRCYKSGNERYMY